MNTQPDAATVELTITGMHCEACVALIEELLTERSGVRRATIDLEAKLATVTYDASTVGVEELCATVADAGYEATMRESA